MLIFLDVETTGLEKKDRVCSIAIIAIDDEKTESFYELVNEGKKIPALASSINHITNEMIKTKPKLIESKIYKFLLEHNKPSTTIVGHNVKFDLDMLHVAGYNFVGEIVDTLRVTKHLIPECEFFSLQFLRYELKLYKKEKESLHAHDAQGDVQVVQYLYEYLLDMGTRESFVELSFKKVLIKKFEFGKYSGRYIEEISMIDRGYLEWMLGNIVDMNEDLRYSIGYYL
ncbi:MAG: exonuclease domain-containing protein [Campylobacterota bacterium]|nr:exonuclease domain-containing protein [Campylobacterota bacterium]